MNPDFITYSRFFLGVLMVFFAFFGWIYLFSFVYALSIISDILDGFLARKLKRTTEFGKKLDITADKIIVLCAFLSLFFLGKLKDIWIFLIIYMYYFISQILSLIFRKKFIFIRNFSANFAAVIFPFVVFSMAFYYIPFFTYAYAILMFYSTTNKIFITLNLKNKLVFFLVFIVVSFSILIMLKTKSACFENKCIEIEIMDSPTERSLGLMFREKIDENKGMLFIFEKPDYYTFYMKNMNFPIDMIFLDENFKVVTIFNDVPKCIHEPCSLYTPLMPSKYVIETKSNFTLRHNIAINSKVSIN